MSDVAVAPGSAPRKMFTVDTGTYTTGCTRDKFFWYFFYQPDIDIHFENDQVMSASITEPGNYWIEAYLYANDSDGDFCYDTSFIRVRIP